MNDGVSGDEAGKGDEDQAKASPCPAWAQPCPSLAWGSQPPPSTGSASQVGVTVGGVNGRYVRS